MSEPAAQASEDLLKSALSTSFTPITVERDEVQHSSQPEAVSSSGDTAATTTSPDSLVSEEERAEWEQEHTALQAQWKEESARQRKESEERRAHIAAERSATGDTWEKLDQEHPARGPPNQTVEYRGYPGSPSPADVRDSVAGEPSGSKTHAMEASQVSIVSQTTTPEHSQPWEEVPSMESSYPDITFPEHSSPDLSTRNGRRKTQHHPDEKHTPESGPTTTGKARMPPSATLSIFDSRLSGSTRAWALVSALSINLLLPFINGVMLGFGEIFARTVAGHFGWKIPGGAATAVGVGAANVSKQERAERASRR